jgi:uncharacterized protein (DUF305 family)
MNEHDTSRDQHRMMVSHYRRLALMTALSFMAMYGLMYAMVNTISNVYPSFNQAYMAGLMTAPMVVLELILMGMMYKNRRWNVAIFLGATAVGVLCFLAIRQQSFVGDREFARSMIPHHSGAILMCREADLSDPRLRSLCKTIIAGQQAEIDQLTAILNEKPAR